MSEYAIQDIDLDHLFREDYTVKAETPEEAQEQLEELIQNHVSVHVEVEEI